MYIRNVIIENFSCFSNLKVAMPDKLGYIAKENGTGKSSFIEALVFALTGKCDRDCIMHGKDFCSVTLDIENDTDKDTVCHRLVTDKKGAVVNEGLLNGKKVSQKDLDKYLLTIYGISIQNIESINAAKTGELSPSELAGMLLMFIPNKLSYDKLVSLLSEPLTDTEDELLRSELPDIDISMGDIEKAYQSLYAKRTLYKKEAKNIIGARDSLKTDMPAVTESDAAAKADGLRKSISNYENLKKLNDSYDKTEKLISENKRTADGLRERIKAIGSPAFDPKREQELKDQKKQINNKIFANERLKAGFLAEIGNIQKQLVNIGVSECPLFSGVKCSLDKSSLKESLELKMAAARKTVDEISGQNDLLQVSLEDLESSEKSVREIHEAVTLKGVLTEQLEKVCRLCPVLPDKPDKISEDELQHLKELLADYEKFQNAWTGYKRYLEFSKKADEAEKMIAAYDSTVKMLSPKGNLNNTVVNYYTTFFNGKCNECAKEIDPAFEIKLVADNGILITAKTPTNDNFTPYKRLSEGEKLIVSLIITDMFNSLTGIDMLFVDNLDKLDTANLEKVIRLFKSDYGKKYSNIILCTVYHNDTSDIFNKYGIKQVI